MLKATTYVEQLMLLTSTLDTYILYDLCPLLAALNRYDGELRRLTSGTASFTMEYARHDEMTQHEVDQVH